MIQYRPEIGSVNRARTGNTCISVSGKFMRTVRNGTSIRQRIWLKSHKRATSNNKCCITATTCSPNIKVRRNAKENLSPDAWMKKLLSSEDSGVGLSGCSDPIVEMAMTAFTSLMLLATQIDSKNEEEQKAAISEAMDRREIDLTSLLPGMKSCDLVIGENGRAVLQADNGSVQVSRELTSAELSRLSVTLNDGSLSEEAKRLRVTGLLNTVILSEAASLNFEQGMAEQRGQTENLKR